MSESRLRRAERFILRAPREGASGPDVLAIDARLLPFGFVARSVYHHEWYWCVEDARGNAYGDVATLTEARRLARAIHDRPRAPLGGPDAPP